MDYSKITNAIVPDIPRYGRTSTYMEITNYLSQINYRNNSARVTGPGRRTRNAGGEMGRMCLKLSMQQVRAPFATL